jgi:predicted O-methyltransferase YrrM
LYNEAAAFVYPSYGEGFGIPLLEAMACGCPVVASDIPSSREVAGDCPLYFAPSEPESLSDIFSAVLGESRDSKRVREGLLLANGYSWDKTAAQTLDVYRKALLDKGRYDCCAFPSGHYYSPVPDLEDVACRDEVVFAVPDTLEDINLNVPAQLALWDEMKAYRDEFPFGNLPGELRYGLSNGFFGHGDAWVLYGMIRACRPARIVEIGSGYSSAAILDINDLFLDGNLLTTFIDPHPERLTSLLREHDKDRSTIIRTPVQDADPAVFDQLGQGDILFVDSSHVSKVGSDVNYVLFEILPRLQPGVIITFHDVFYPFEYPRNWVMQGRFWNECYLLRAFLQNNSQYSIMVFNSYLAKMHRRKVGTDVPIFLQRDPDNKWVEGCSSLWLRKE